MSIETGLIICAVFILFTTMSFSLGVDHERWMDDIWEEYKKSPHYKEMMKKLKENE